MKKKQLFQLIAVTLLLLTTFNANSQDKQYTSSKSIVAKANGVSTSVTKEKNVYFQFYIRPNSLSVPNNRGTIWITDAPRMTKSKEVTQTDEFRIYTMELKDNGTYNYWTIDVGNDGQTVLFQVDNNIATPTISVSRYAPGEESKVLKTIIYYLD